MRFTGDENMLNEHRFETCGATFLRRLRNTVMVEVRVKMHQPNLDEDGRIVNWVEVVAPEVEAVGVPLAAIEAAAGGAAVSPAVAAAV